MRTGIEGLRFILGPESPPTAIGWSPQHVYGAPLRPTSRAVYSLGGCNKLPELLGRRVLRVPSCRSCEGVRNWP